MNIWISGVGGVGGWIAHALASAGEGVSLVVRPGTAARWQETGLTLITEDGRRPTLHLPVSEQLDALARPDLVVVTVKLPDLAAALARLGPHLPDAAPVLLLQNGLSAGELAQAALPGRAFIHAPVALNGWTSAPGEITAYLPRRIVLPRHEAIGAAFRRAGIDAQTVQDLPLALWRKAVFLIAFAALDAETGGGAAGVVAMPRFRALIAELAVLAAAEGHPLPGGAADEILGFAKGMRPDHHSSLWRDLQRGREGEWEQLVGWCQCRARSRSLDLPVLAGLTRPTPIST